MAFVNPGLKSVLTLAAALTAFVSADVKAQSNTDHWRWFEVEVLVLKHTGNTASKETFPLTVDPIAVDRSRDVLTPYYGHKSRALRSALPTCEQLADNHWQINLGCQYDNEDNWLPIPGNPFAPKNPLANLAHADVVIDGPGGDIHNAAQPFLMPKEVLELSETRTTLQTKGQAEPLLHLAWRQPVFTRGVGRKYRLFGGKNFSDRFFYNGFPKEQHRLNTPLSSASQEQRMDNIEQLIALIDTGKEPFDNTDNQTPIRPPLTAAGLPQLAWEFDGLIHIFLVGNYLHIDGDFNLREPHNIKRIANNLDEQASLALNHASDSVDYLRGYHFSQLRRVISHETHYFDHPKLGVVVQIRRTDLSAPRY